MIQEDKRNRFLRLAEKRTNEVLERIRILGNCSNRGQYEYAQPDVLKIFSVIEKELKHCKLKFSGSKQNKFRLST